MSRSVADRGPRHQTDVELKWAMHPDGERRRGAAAANGHATTISVLIHGALRATFHLEGTPHVVTLQKEGDYVVFGPDIVHSWEALGDTVVLSVRFPSIEVGRTPELADGREAWISHTISRPGVLDPATSYC